jgi:hypothetical protein
MLARRSDDPGMCLAADLARHCPRPFSTQALEGDLRANGRRLYTASMIDFAQRSSRVHV